MRAWQLLFRCRFLAPTAVVSVAIAGCGGGDGHSASGVSDRSAGPVVATVQSTPITRASYRHWMGIAFNELGVVPGRAPVPAPPLYAGCVKALRAEPAAPSPARVLRARCARDYQRARSDAISFLVRAQWLAKEGSARGVHVSSAALRTAVSKAIRQRYDGDASFKKFLAKTGMTRADFSLTVKVNMIADALQAQAMKVPAVTAGQVARYYRAHRSRYAIPPRRLTLMVVTQTRATALQARAALKSGRSWAAVAKRYSEDSSKLVGGAYEVVPGIQPPKLVRAVFTAPHGVLEGPVAVQQPSGSSGSSLYYLFKVTRDQKGFQQPLGKVRSQVRQTVRQDRQQHAFTSFVNAYTKRWKARTHCRPGYVVQAVCGNGGGKPGG